MGCSRGHASHAPATTRHVATTSITFIGLLGFIGTYSLANPHALELYRYLPELAQ